MNRICGRRGKRRQVRVGAADPALTANAGLAAITELCGRLGVTGAIDAVAGPIKQRDRGFGAGELLAGIASAQLAPAARPPGMATPNASTDHEDQLSALLADSGLT